MNKLLLFQLAAPMGAFGSVAVGERRSTERRPSHSGLIGLIGASLGIVRTDPAQAALSSSYVFATRKDGTGSVLGDYHTTQAPSTRKGVTWDTRRDELSGDLNTVLSQRDYVTDISFTIACLANIHAIEPLDKVAEALKQPVFVPYIGRKSCPLSLPLCPLIIEASKVQYAMAKYDEFRANKPGHRNSSGEIATDEAFFAAGLITEDEIERFDMRRDIPLSRTVWRHDLRREIILRPTEN